MADRALVHPPPRDAGQHARALRLLSAPSLSAAVVLAREAPVCVPDVGAPVIGGRAIAELMERHGAFIPARGGLRSAVVKLVGARPVVVFEPRVEKFIREYDPAWWIVTTADNVLRPRWRMPSP